MYVLTLSFSPPLPLLLFFFYSHPFQKVFLPAFALTKGRIAASVGAGLTSKDLESAIMRSQGQQWVQLQMMAQQNMQTRFAKGLQLIMNPAGLGQ